jgi:hypothetical protein
VPKQHIMNICEGNGEPPLILDLGKCAQLHVPANCSRVDSSKHHLHIGLEGSQRSMNTAITKTEIPTHVRKRNLRCPLRNQTLHQTVSLGISMQVETR